MAPKFTDKDRARLARILKGGPDLHRTIVALEHAIKSYVRDDALPDWTNEERNARRQMFDAPASTRRVVRFLRPGLNWNRHVERDRPLIRLPRAKTGVPRALPYSGNARIKRVLSKAARVEHRSGAVFLDSDGQAIEAEALKTAMRRAWKRAGLTKSRPWKTLRATFATRKAEAGVDVPTIPALMGLTTSHVLEHYVKPSGKHLEAAMADRLAANY